MENEKIQKIKSFIQRLQQREQELMDYKIEKSLLLYKHFLPSYTHIKKLALLLIENEASKFNLFDILRISHLEAKVHTPFLAHLFNPNETHRQGKLFFDSFMKLVFKENYFESEVSSIRVKQEISDKENGRVDIIIFYKNKEEEKAIVIENKIYHHDEDQQLERYYKTLTKTYGFRLGSYHLVYLKPNRGKPGKESITDETFNFLKKNNSVTLLGYKEDIAPMLFNVMPTIKAPIVKETIKQYIQTIKSF